MSRLIGEEVGFLLRSFWWGIVIGSGYELVGLFRRVWSRRQWWRGCEDLLYWTICAVFLFSVICKENGGILRWYVLAATAAGAGIYYGGIRPILCRILNSLWILARKTIQFVENLLKKRKKSVTLIDKMENSTTGAERGSRHGRLR